MTDCVKAGILTERSMADAGPSIHGCAREERTNSRFWWTAFRQRSVWARGAKLGLSVGVLQAILNQGDVWLARTETAGTIFKTILSPLVTFSVALVSAAATYVDKLKTKS